MCRGPSRGASSGTPIRDRAPASMFGGYHRGGSWRGLPPQVQAAQSPRGHHISLGWSPVARARRSRLAVLPCEHQSANKSSGASTGDHRSGLAMAGLRRERSFSLSAGRWQFGGFRLDLPAPRHSGSVALENLQSDTLTVRSRKGVCCSERTGSPSVGAPLLPAEVIM